MSTRTRKSNTKPSVDQSESLDSVLTEELLARFRIISCITAQVPFELAFGRKMNKLERALVRALKEELK